MDTNMRFSHLVVVKRSGQRTNFEGEKIALAIKKSFDSLESNYKKEEVNKIYQAVLKKIDENYKDRKTIKIEQIQDLIEEALKKHRFYDVYESFKNYREQRSLSRETFVVKQQHKFLKAIESLGLNTEEPNPILEEKNPKDVLYTFGSIIAKEFSKAYLLDHKLVSAIEQGFLYMDAIEYIPMGSCASVNLNLHQITSGAKDLKEALQKILLVIENVSHDLYRNQNLIDFDQVLISFFLNDYKTLLKKQIYAFLDDHDFLSFVSLDSIYRQLDLFSMEQKIYTLPFLEDKPFLKMGFSKAEQRVREELMENLKNSLISFFNHLTLLAETKHIFTSISFGSNTTECGMLFQNILLNCIPKQTKMTFIFQVISCQKQQNLLKKALLLKSIFYHLEEGASYGFLGERIKEDITAKELYLCGKGVLSSIYINLVHIALKHAEETLFFQELEDVLELACDSLLKRFEIQCSKHSFNFPYLIEQGIWLDGEKTKPEDRLRKLLKHGTLNVGFVGLKETTELLSSIKKEELALKILSVMRQKIDYYSNKHNLNFVLSGIEHEIAEKNFIEIDQTIYGKIKNITNKIKYNTSYHGFDSIDFKLEAQFQMKTNGGHQAWIKANDKQKLELLEKAKKVGIQSVKFI